MRARLSIVGGFLGAGKTSLLLSLAKLLKSQGERVAVITNDQGRNLIDTKIMNASEVHAAEVTGGCFCCKFPEFERLVLQLSAEHQPTWILAEAVGSCTDLTATVARPMQRFHGQTLQITPITIVVDPDRAYAKWCEAETEFPSEVDYLYEQQIKEADVVLLNKADRTSDEIYGAVRNRIRSLRPGTAFTQTSALSGRGVEQWLDYLINPRLESGNNLLNDLNYERYAVAEAHLGWVNVSLRLSAPHGFDLGDLVQFLGGELQSRLFAEHMEAAHVKMMGLSAEGRTNGSLTTTRGPWRWISAVIGHSTQGMLIINARVCASPEALSRIIQTSVSAACQRFEVLYTVTAHEAFRPSPPTPTYREVVP